MTNIPEDVLAEWGATPEPSQDVREHLAAEGRVCSHCGEPLSATHRRRWPDASKHVTCASGEVINGACPHTVCDCPGKYGTGCCNAHRLSAPARTPSPPCENDPSPP